MNREQRRNQSKIGHQVVSKDMPVTVNIGYNPPTGTVVMQFNRALNNISWKPKGARDVAEQLIKAAAAMETIEAQAEKNG